MQDPISQNIEKESKFILSNELINGYYLSFLSIGLFLVMLRNDINSDIKQGVFFILMALVFGSIDLFKNAATKENILDQENKSAKTVIYGNYYNRVGDEVYNTANENISDIRIDLPSNYFDVLKTIEVLPVSTDSGQPGIKDVLIQLHSYVESDSTLLVSEKEMIFELIKRMAIEAKSDSVSNDIEYVVESIQKIDRNSDFQSQIVQALKASAISASDEQLSPIRIVVAAIAGWMEKTSKNI
jgi:hypothetical protein